MDSWIFQGGYPLIGADIDGGRLVLTQERFTYLPDATPARWDVPVLVAWGTEGGETASQRVLLDGDRTEIDLGGPVDWVLVNQGGSGFYRVAYSSELRTALADRAGAELEPIERYQFLDDLSAATLAGRVPAPDLLDVVLRFEDETDLSVWQRLVGALHGLRRLVDGEAKARLTERAATLLAPAYDRLGPLPVEGESDRDAELRAVLFAALGTVADDPDARARAAELHRAYLKNRPSVDPALAAAAAGILADVGEAADYDAFLDRFKNAADPQEEQRYLYLLADFEDPELFARTLDLTLTDQVRSQNAPYVLRRALINRERSADAWTWITEHWDEANARFPSNSIPRMLGGVRAIDRADLADDVEAWMDAHPVPAGRKAAGPGPGAHAGERGPPGTLGRRTGSRTSRSRRVRGEPFATPRGLRRRARRRPAQLGATGPRRDRRAGTAGERRGHRRLDRGRGRRRSRRGGPDRVDPRHRLRHHRRRPTPHDPNGRDTRRVLSSTGS